VPQVSFVPDTGVESAGLQIVKTHARFYGVNLLSELDEPGEYFIDEPTRMLYFLPTTGGDIASKPATLSVNSSAVVPAPAHAHTMYTLNEPYAGSQKMHMCTQRSR
jgi:hypothetical protein